MCWILRKIVGLHIYRGKRGLGQGNVFTGVFFCPQGRGLASQHASTGHITSIRGGGGGVGFPACITGYMTREGLHPGGFTSRESLPMGGLPTGGRSGSRGSAYKGIGQLRPPPRN